MNKLIVLAALALAGSPALASKARVTALNNSRQLSDVQYVFERPYLVNSIGELATMEWGTKGDNVAPHAEFGFLKKHGEANYGLYLGKQGFLSEKAAGAFLDEQNPINLVYGTKTGDISWGVNLSFSNGKDDATNKKSSSSGLNLGATFGMWEVELGTALSGKSEEAANTVEVKGDMKLGVGYIMDEMKQAYLTYRTNKVETNGVAEEKTEMDLGFINTLVKNDDANFFYGIAYHSDKVKDGAETTSLPVWMGIEANATSWMVMRASLKQNVLINEVKAANGNKTDADSIAFAAGAGIKLNKGMLDVSFGNDSQAGQFNYAKGGFLTNAAYTYSF